MYYRGNGFVLCHNPTKDAEVEKFQGYHSEWNLGSPGGWDYQKTTQIIGKAVWQKLSSIHKFHIDLDFDHQLFFPVDGFAEMLIAAHRAREGRNSGIIAVVAEEETLEDVTENRNLAQRLSLADGITGVLMAPQELELKKVRFVSKASRFPFCLWTSTRMFCWHCIANMI